MVGKDEYTNRLNCRVGVLGYWSVNFTDAQVDELLYGRRTRDWWDHTLAPPIVLWDFNQASTGTAVTDLTKGGADQSAIVGTAVSTTDDPPGWAFGLGTRQTLRPNSDVATTGWTATPLHSKLSDQSDATLVSATLA